MQRKQKQFTDITMAAYLPLLCGVSIIGSSYSRKSTCCYLQRCVLFCLLWWVDSSSCYHVVLPLLKHHWESLIADCVCEKHPQDRRGISSHHGCPQSFYSMRLFNKLFPFCPGVSRC